MFYSDEEELYKKKPGITRFNNAEDAFKLFLDEDRERLGQSHRAVAARANLVNVNQIPIECEKCKGDLEGVDAGRYRCVACGHINRDSIRKIRDYSDEHGAQPAVVIARETGVSRSAVEYFLLDESLEIPEWSEVTINCQKCGAAIRTGRLCENCKRQMTIASSHKTKKEDKSKSGLMYTRRKEDN